MKKIRIFNLVVWLIIGLIVLNDKDITRLSYGLCWGCLLINLIDRAVE